MERNGIVTIQTEEIPSVGEKITLRKDSTIKGCIWHRLKVDAQIPEETTLEITYATSDEDTKEPNLKWSETKINPTDILIEQPRGRFLWLKISVNGLDDRKTGTPYVRSITLYFSPATFLGYLPAIYQEDPGSQSFLENYLSVFETILANIESHITETPQLFDARETPSDFLPWLSTWLGTVKDDNWPEATWRDFLSRAVEFYKMRGTKTQLIELIELFTGKKPLAIIERAILKCGSENAKNDEVLERLLGDNYSFCVLLTPDQVKTEANVKALKRIIDSEKPAHTQGGLAIIENRIHLDWHTYLEVNTYLTEPKAESYVGEATIPLNSKLAS